MKRAGSGSVRDLQQEVFRHWLSRPGALEPEVERDHLLGQIAHAADVPGPLRHGDRAARLQRVKRCETRMTQS